MTTPTSDQALTALDAHFLDRQRMWAGGWRRYVFPGLWLVYLAQTVYGVHLHSRGFGTVIGYAIVVAFVVCYLLAFPQAWIGNRRRYLTFYFLSFGLLACETFFAHDDAFVFCTYLSVLTMAGLRHRAWPIVFTLAAIAVFVPRLVPAWHESIEWASGLAPLLVGFAMYGFFSIIESNMQLAEARAEVARLAAENERSRIARDLHDLLGHSLTTITVKAALARRLAERGETARAAEEIASVEELSRRSLTDVRAAVSGYHDVTLVGELATGREVLRASTIAAELPGAVDIVRADLDELFGWVVREGITNVVRHSRATRCTVTLGPDWVEIVDDGRGIGGPCGNGLTGLNDRVAAAGGTTSAGSVSGGWRLRVDVPALITATPGTTAPDPAAPGATAPRAATNSIPA